MFVVMVFLVAKIPTETLYFAEFWNFGIFRIYCTLILQNIYIVLFTHYISTVSLIFRFRSRFRSRFEFGFRLGSRYVFRVGFRVRFWVRFRFGFRLGFGFRFRSKSRFRFGFRFGVVWK